MRRILWHVDIHWKQTHTKGRGASCFVSGRSLEELYTKIGFEATKRAKRRAKPWSN